MQSWCRCDWWSLLAVALPVVAQMLLFVLLPGALLADLRQLLFLVKPKTGGGGGRRRAKFATEKAAAASTVFPPIKLDLIKS